MTTDAAFVAAFVAFARDANITVMGTVSSVKAVVKRFIRSSFLFEYDMGFHLFGYSSTVLKNLFTNGFKTHVFVKGSSITYLSSKIKCLFLFIYISCSDRSLEMDEQE